jgi:hypothetical protein
LRPITLERRRFLMLGLGTTIGLTLPTACTIDPVLDRYLKERVPGPATLRSPDRTGPFTNDLADKLFQLVSWVSHTWQLSDDGGNVQARLMNALQAKVIESPSYLEEYSEGAALIDFAQKRVAVGEVFAILIAGNLGWDFGELSSTRLGRFRTFVSDEIITMQVAFGGFKRFGLQNYRGYQGGTFVDPASPPFRRMPS